MYSVPRQLNSSLQNGFLVELLHQVLLNSNEGEETTERIRILSPPLSSLFSFILFAIFFLAIRNRPFSCRFEPHYESEASCIVFVMNISFHSYANKTNFHMLCT